MAKIKDMLKKNKYYVLVMLFTVIALFLCIVIIRSSVRNALLNQWKRSLSGSTESIDELGISDDDTMITTLGEYYDNKYIAGSPVETIVYFKRNGSTQSMGTVLYSTIDACESGSSISDFFSDINAYSVYNRIIQKDSGTYGSLTMDGEKYYVIYSYIDSYKLTVVEFIPQYSTTVLFRDLSLGILALVVIFMLSMGLVFCRFRKEKLGIIAEREEAIQTMHDKDARMDMLSYLMNEFTFEYDIEKDVLSFSEKYQTIFQRGKTFVHFRENLRTHYEVYHMDADNLFNAYNDIINGKEEGNVLFRLQMSSGNYEWFNALYKVMYKDDHVPYFVVGKLVNVHQSHTEKEMLLKKSTRDPLTNLLNRSEIEKRTTNYIDEMDSEDFAALLIMDLDHFKQVNDTFGHSRGDDLLRDVANELRDSFRTNDIVGRLGGDEFYIFMKDIANEKDAVNKCEKVRLTLNRDVIYEDTAVHISASMGIVFVREDAKFLDIYMKADSALYRAKEAGRNRICVYEETSAGEPQT